MRGNGTAVVESELVARFNGEIAHTFNPVYSARMFRLARRVNLLGWFFERLVVSGMEAMKGDRTRVFFGNHQSHFDYGLAWYAFNEKGMPTPRFAAGKNLDHPLFLGAVGMDFRQHGAFFVDRDLVAGQDPAINRAYLSALREQFNNMLDKGESLFVFPEGGRSYDGTVMQDVGRVKKTTFKLLTASPDLRDVDVVPVAFAYSPRIEEYVFKFLGLVNGRETALERALYYGIDLGSFAVRPLSRLANSSARLVLPLGPYSASAVFGQPINLREAFGHIKPALRWPALRSRVVQDVRDLYEQARANIA